MRTRKMDTDPYKFWNDSLTARPLTTRSDPRKQLNANATISRWPNWRQSNSKSSNAKLKCTHAVTPISERHELNLHKIQSHKQHLSTAEVSISSKTTSSIAKLECTPQTQLLANSIPSFQQKPRHPNQRQRRQHKTKPSSNNIQGRWHFNFSTPVLQNPILNRLNPSFHH
jgi:hypothetical protein